jgi:hypothetical protein
MTKKTISAVLLWLAVIALVLLLFHAPALFGADYVLLAAILWLSAQAVDHT